jgi:hypothetical protein
VILKCKTKYSALTPKVKIVEMEQKWAAVGVSDLVRPWHANFNAEYT